MEPIRLPPLSFVDGVVGAWVNASRAPHRISHRFLVSVEVPRGRYLPLNLSHSPIIEYLGGRFEMHVAGPTYNANRYTDRLNSSGFFRFVPRSST